MSEMFSMATVAAATLHVPHGRYGEPGTVEHVGHLLSPRFGERVGIHSHLGVRRVRVGRNRNEQLARIAPELVQRGLSTRVALVGSVAQRNHPLSGVPD